VQANWRKSLTAGLIQDFMELAEPTPTFLLDTNITPIHDSKMQPASSFTFNPVQLYSTCNWGPHKLALTAINKLFAL
jgi:hypothetical protein